MSDDVLYGLALVGVGTVVMGVGTWQLWNLRILRALIGAAAIGAGLWCIREGVAILPGHSDAHQVFVACVSVVVVAFLAFIGALLIAEAQGELEVRYSTGGRDVRTAVALFCRGLVAIGFAIVAMAMSW